MEFQGGWNSNTYACNFNVASTLWHELHRIIRVGAEESDKRRYDSLALTIKILWGVVRPLGEAAGLIRYHPHHIAAPTS